MDRFDEYRVSERVVLKKGTRFRVSGGPLYKTKAGDLITCKARGVMTFLSAYVQGGCTYLEAISDRDGACVLHVEGERRNAMLPELVCAPYRVRSRVTGRRRRRKPK